MNPNFISAFLGTSLLVGSVLGEEPIQQSNLLSLVSVAGKDAFVISTIPASDAIDQSVKTRALFSEHDIKNYHVCGVYGGYLIVLEDTNELPTRFLAIDLTTGKKKLISQAACEKAILANRHLYFLVEAQKQTDNLDKPSHALHMMDLQTGIQRELCLLTCSDPQTFLHGYDITLAATADGSKVAVTELALDDRRLCRIVIANSSTGEVTRSQPNFASRLWGTGAGFWRLAPKLFWMDDQTLLIASADGYETQKLFCYQPETQSTNEICNLPQYHGSGFDPTFSLGSDGKKIVRLGSLGAFEILLQNKKLMEYNESLSGYLLKQEGKHLSLHDAENELASEIDRSRIFASPDAQQIAWLPVAARNGMILHEPMELKVHDRSRGVRTVLTEIFPYWFQAPSNDRSAVCWWLSDADLHRSNVFDPLSDYSPPHQTPSVDSRPAIHESVELSLKTDRQNYLRHEPIELSITVKNLASTPIQFESRWLKGGTQPFNDLYLVTKDEKVEIKFNEGYSDELLDEFVTIAAGQSLEFKLTVETAELDLHELQMRFEHYSFWQGHLKAIARFRVGEGGNEAEMKRKKFDRLVLQSLREFRNNPSGSVNRDRFRQLGSSCSPLLVEYLQKCEDSSFRRFLGCGLPTIADETTLPFLKGLLESDLEVDGDLVVESLWGIYRRGNFASRPVPETTLLLIEAGKHRNVEVRRKAVATLCHSVNEVVDTFMQQAVEDSNEEVAQSAARYVAARQQLPLQSWLTEARFTITPAGLVTARSIILELEQLSQEKHGRVPDGTFEEVIADSSKVAEYSATLKAWILYCATHTRIVVDFFDKDRIARTTWQGWGIDRYASGSNEPIKLKPRSQKLLD